MRRLGLALAVSVVLSAPLATAAEPATSVIVQWGINEDGRGHVTANPVPDGSWGSITWNACTPDDACRPAGPEAESDEVLDVGDAPAGTSFTATASDGERSVSGTSAPY